MRFLALMMSEIITAPIIVSGHFRLHRSTWCRAARHSLSEPWARYRCYSRYARVKAVTLTTPLKDELEARRIDSRSWTSASGRLVGGKPFSRGALYLILQNRISRGSGSPEIKLHRFSWRSPVGEWSRGARHAGRQNSVC